MFHVKQGLYGKIMFHVKHLVSGNRSIGGKRWNAGSIKIKMFHVKHFYPKKALFWFKMFHVKHFKPDCRHKTK